MTEVPDLIAADDDRVIVAGRFRLVQREAPRAGQGSDRIDELAGLRTILRQFPARGPFGQLGLKRAPGFGAADALAIMVEQLGIVTAGTQRFDQASRLPVGPVIYALVEGQDTDLAAPRNHAQTNHAWLFAFLTLIWVTPGGRSKG